MPLILMVGLPSSGKTTRAREIQKYFVEHQSREVVLISDNDIISQMNIDKNVLFLGNSILIMTRDVYAFSVKADGYWSHNRIL